jgi:3-phenylpropionate/trans-cinnamate dioxygenase alpha subunit
MVLGLRGQGGPPQVKEAIRLAGVQGFSPSGTFEQDDMDNWQECTRTCRGVVSRRYHLNMQMGLGHDRFDEALMASASDYRFSESNHRQFYRRWAQLMAAESWAELISDAPSPMAKSAGH